MKGNAKEPKPTVAEKRAEEFSAKMDQWREVFEAVLKEDSWLSGLKKVSTSKKAVVALSGLVGTLASWAGVMSVTQDTSLQVLISTVALGAMGLVASVYLWAQGKSDGPEGKETELMRAKENAKLELLEKLPKA